MKRNIASTNETLPVQWHSNNRPEGDDAAMATGNKWLMVVIAIYVVCGLVGFFAASGGQRPGQGTPLVLYSADDVN